jgi:hypothetical protein
VTEHCSSQADEDMPLLTRFYGFSGEEEPLRSTHLTLLTPPRPPFGTEKIQPNIAKYNQMQANTGKIRKTIIFGVFAISHLSAAHG